MKAETATAKIPISLCLHGEHTSPAVLIVSQQVSVREAIEQIPIIWVASESEEWTDRIVELPL